ncbi:MAG: rhodanese-like domain-containing protein [Actinomycetota bacterium]|nr:rhodanese-like domain-containing protein [Actinomycetota bacterium]
MPGPRFAGVEELLADARSRLDRLDARAAAAAVRRGALLVDIRPAAQRESEREIPGAFVIERNDLEWRLDPGSDARIAQALPGQRWIVFCSQGYTSSLAADALNSIGVPATDIVGGLTAWAAAGQPTVAGGSPAGTVTAAS